MIIYYINDKIEYINIIVYIYIYKDVNSKGC